MPEISLYLYMGSPQCRAVLMTAKMLGLEPTIYEVDMMQNFHKTKEFAKINPDQTLPALIDGGHRVSKSREIMKYLCNAYGGNEWSGKKPLIYPKTQKMKLINDVLNYDEFYVAPVVHSYVVGILQDQDENTMRELEDELKAILSDFNNKLAGLEYVTGEIGSIADISLRFSLHMLNVLKYDFGPYRNIVSWMERVDGLPFYNIVDEMFKEWMRKKEMTPRRCCPCKD